MGPLTRPQKVKPMPKIVAPADLQPLIEDYQHGRDLLYLIDLPGHKVLMDLFRKDIEAAQKALTAYGDSDAQYALRLLAELQGRKKALAAVERQVQRLAALVDAPPEAIHPYISY